MRQGLVKHSTPQPEPVQDSGSTCCLSIEKGRYNVTAGMNSPIVTQVFRQLFSHQTCSRLLYTTSILPSISAHRRFYQKKSAEETYDDGESKESHWQQRTEFLPPDKVNEYKRYPMVNVNALRTRKERPRRVKMLMRDFIEGIIASRGDGEHGMVLKYVQIVFTTPTTATSRNRPSSLPLASHLISAYYLMKPLFTSFLDKGIQNLKMRWMSTLRVIRGSYGIRPLSSSDRITGKPLHSIWSRITSCRITPFTI